MKNTMCLALIILAVIPVSTQKADHRNRSETRDDVTELSQDYAAHVDGLLREVHARLQNISAQTEAGTITSARGHELKLVATRDMIARLDALAAIYTARLDAEHEATADAASAAIGDRAHAISKTRGTVNVQELKRESESAGATAGTEVAR